MPDFQYKQTSVTLDVRGIPFNAVGRQPTELGWRSVFPDWKPSSKKGDDAALLPPMRGGETAQLHNAAIEDKKTRPASRFNEGTLIEAMQNAWRYFDDGILRERLKEAKGIGTPATRAEIIGGLKKQNFLIAQRKNIVPTENGLKLFNALKQADPALVDPGVTATLECLLDDVIVGKQNMTGAIDAVCDVAKRIIENLNQGGNGDGPALIKPSRNRNASELPPTTKMISFANSLAKQKKIQPPPGYTKLTSVCRLFLDTNAPKKTGMLD